MGLIEKLKLWLSAYLIIWKRQVDPSIWAYQLFIFLVGASAFFLVFGIFYGFHILLGFDQMNEYYAIVSILTSFIVGVLALIRISYEILSRGWI